MPAYLASIEYNRQTFCALIIRETATQSILHDAEWDSVKQLWKFIVQF